MKADLLTKALRPDELTRADTTKTFLSFCSKSLPSVQTLSTKVILFDLQLAMRAYTVPNGLSLISLMIFILNDTSCAIRLTSARFSYGHSG